MAKMGRPSLSEKPSRLVTFRLAEEEADAFELKLNRLSLTKSQVLRELVSDWLEEEM